MVNKIKLEVYILKIREKRGESYVNLHDFNSTNFYDLFQDFILENQVDFGKNDLQEKTMRFKPYNVSFKDKRITGIIESGDYGYESEIYSTTTQIRTHEKKKDETEIKPFYFMLYLPDHEQETAFFVMQRFGGYGVNTILKSQLYSHLKKVMPEYVFDFSPFVSKKLAKKMIEDGEITQLTLSRYDLPSDITDRLYSYSSAEDRIEMQLRLVAKKGSKLGINQSAKRHIESPDARFFSVQSLGFGGDHDAKIKVKYNGSTRTIDLSDTAQIRPYHDIDSEVKKEDSGHPEFESIDSIAWKLILDLLRED